MGTRTGKPKGRPKGSKNVRSKERRELMDKVSEKLKDTIPKMFTGDAHTLLMVVYKDMEQPLPVRLDAAKAAIRYETPALGTVEVKQNDDQFKESMKRMDVTEVARRVAFMFAAAAAGERV